MLYPFCSVGRRIGGEFPAIFGHIKTPPSLSRRRRLQDVHSHQIRHAAFHNSCVITVFWWCNHDYWKRWLFLKIVPSHPMMRHAINTSVARARRSPVNLGIAHRRCSKRVVLDSSCRRNSSKNVGHIGWGCDDQAHSQQQGGSYALSGCVDINIQMYMMGDRGVAGRDYCEYCHSWRKPTHEHTTTDYLAILTM